MYKSISLSVLWKCTTPEAHATALTGTLEMRIAGPLPSARGLTLIISSR